MSAARARGPPRRIHADALMGEAEKMAPAALARGGRRFWMVT